VENPEIGKRLDGVLEKPEAPMQSHPVKEIEKHGPQKILPAGVGVKDPDGNRKPLKDFLGSLPKGTILKFPNGKCFPKLK
jgi:hypothetical protein